ncbi:MAG: SprB repeat-containing protein [Saprospirales bacterium]|nr:SprB repeat-containing protein [Saprospirales bacterium]
MLKIALIISAFVFLITTPCLSQTPLNDCANLGFETGTFHAWRGTYGSWAANLTANTVDILSTSYGLAPLRHHIRSLADGNVPEVINEAIPFVPPGSQYAIQLGNSINGAQYERLITSFRVDAGNTLFQYQFAVIFEDPDHLPVEQPKFELVVTDQTGNILPCGFYQVTAAAGIDGFKSQGNIRYRNWTTAGVDLRDYVGQIVTVQVSTYDCSQGGHWGMALFDASCLTTGVTPVNYCPGDPEITLEAPLGFRDYRWSTGQTSRRITIQNPKIGDQITVEFTPFSTLSDSCRLFLPFTVPGFVDVLPNQEVFFCNNGFVRLVPSLTGDQFRYRWLPGGDTARVQEVNQPGLYTVEVTKAGGCALFDTIYVHAVEPPQVVLSIEHPSCNGKNDGSISAFVLAEEGVRYWWNTRDTVAKLTGLPSGAYSVTVTGAATGCTAAATQQLVQADSVEVRAGLLRAPLCDNWPAGEAAVAVSAGAPPYSYQWSTGATLDKTPLHAGGTVAVTVTDSEGCQAIDSFRVEPLRAATETTGNMCHHGLSGSIGVNASGGFPPYVYALSSDGPFQAGSEFTQLGSGKYKAYVRDTSGCIRGFPAEVKNLRQQAFVAQLPPGYGAAGRGIHRHPGGVQLSGFDRRVVGNLCKRSPGRSFRHQPSPAGGLPGGGARIRHLRLSGFRIHACGSAEGIPPVYPECFYAAGRLGQQLFLRIGVFQSAQDRACVPYFRPLGRQGF